MWEMYMDMVPDKAITYIYTPIVKTNLGKCSSRYKGPVIWNSILTAHINPDTSEAVFAKTLKHCIVIGITQAIITICRKIVNISAPNHEI